MKPDKSRSVKPKKYLGQHFLKDQNIARNIVSALTGYKGYDKVLEIGPGMGVLSGLLFANTQYQTFLMEIDTESVAYLQQHYPDYKENILYQDFLKADLSQLFTGPYAIIGNFPYNISSQIFFKILDEKDKVTEVVCMLQREVAQRISSPPGNKTYGILSVFLQAYYDIEYLFTVEPGVFNPPPKVKSAVIRLRRNEVAQLSCDEKLFRQVVKQGFQNRRKTLRNALKPLNLPAAVRELPVMDQRAEQLSVEAFVNLTNEIEQHAGNDG